jgi:hypothetical protein
MVSHDCKIWTPAERLTSLFRVALTALFVLGTGPAAGHHSESGFDMSSVVGFEGVVTDFVWRNPHVYIYVDEDRADGEVISWQVETGATPIMLRSGWMPNSLSTGDAIAVRGHPERRDERDYVMLISLEKEDGTVMAQSDGEPQQSGSAMSLEGVWKGQAGTVGPFFDALSQARLTAKGQAARDSYDFYRDSPAANCTGPTLPTIVALSLYVNEIRLDGESLQIRSEFFDSDRVVHMDGRQHPDDIERTRLGHSIGWWDEDVLVVDTRRFADHRSGNGNGVPGGAEKHVVERYSLSADGTHIVVEVFLEDPEYLAAPFEGSVQWGYAPEFELYRYECDPEVSSLFRLE